MAEGILGLGQGQAASLNQDLIDRLKAAEKKARVEPLETQLEDITKERETFTTINTKVSEVLNAIKPFDLFVSGGQTAFDQKAATTSGTSVVFEASDTSKLNKGITSVDVKTLAQKDVYQSNAVNAATKDALGDIGTLTIQIGSDTHNFNTADYSTYDELATAINAKTGISAAVDQVGTDSYRLIIKSADTGTANALTISGAASQTLGYTTDGTTVNATNHTLTAQDMTAEVDGVSYSVSTNVLNVDGLKMTATATGVSSINVNDDKSQIATQLQDFITKYNELVDLVEDELQNADSKVADKSNLRDVLSLVKSKLFGQYGASDDKSIFNYGFEVDKSGKLSLDTNKFNSAIEDDFDGLKDLFVGTAAKEGLGTQLKAVFDEMSFSGGVLDSFSDSIDSREKTLKEEKEKAQKDLDDKYSQLAQRFASYSAIITGFESSFSGLKMMIQQSTSSS